MKLPVIIIDAINWEFSRRNLLIFWSIIKIKILFYNLSKIG